MQPLRTVHTYAPHTHSGERLDPEPGVQAIPRLRGLWRFHMLWLIPVSLGLARLAGSYPVVTEKLYSMGVYPVLRDTLGRLFSIVPFSVAELLVLLLPVAALLYVIRQITLAVRDKQRRRLLLVRLTANLACAAGVGYFLFVALCGFNYHRESFATLSGLEVRPSSAAELSALCGELAERANLLRAGLPEDESGVMAGSISMRDSAAIARGAYETTARQFPQLGGYTVRPKAVQLSRGMSYLDITGVYTPYTFEANVNTDIPDFSISSTIMHELAHSKGFMREDEANFISYLTCAASGSSDFDYSGTMLALIHSTNALYSSDKDAYGELRERLSEGVKRDLAASNAYWKQFEGPVAQASTAVNDAYLRVNRQSDGVKSYGRMVDLLLAEYRLRHGLE